MRRKSILLFTLLLTAIVIAVIAVYAFFRPLTLNKVITNYDNIESLEIIEWTGSDDKKHQSTSDNIQDLLDFIGNIRVRHALSVPAEFPLLPSESYSIYGKDSEGRLAFSCMLYKGYVLINSNECYSVISPSSFEALRDIADQVDT